MWVSLENISIFLFYQCLFIFSMWGAEGHEGMGAMGGEKNVGIGRVFGITLHAVTNAVRDIDKRRG
jgi:hypothetical protein